MAQGNMVQPRLARQVYDEPKLADARKECHKHWETCPRVATKRMGWQSFKVALCRRLSELWFNASARSLGHQTHLPRRDLVLQQAAASLQGATRLESGIQRRRETLFVIRSQRPPLRSMPSNTESKARDLDQPLPDLPWAPNPISDVRASAPSLTEGSTPMILERLATDPPSQSRATRRRYRAPKRCRHDSGTPQKCLRYSTRQTGQRRRRRH